MFDPTNFAYLFSALIALVVIFQLGLALGAPWGELAMGGKFPGRFPVQMRVVALLQIVVLVFITLVVLTRAGLVFDEYYAFSSSAIWAVVLYSFVGLILNAITPSKKERMLWLPVVTLLMISATFVAVS